MRHAVQSALVLAPSTTLHADQAVVGTLDDLHQVMGEAKHGEHVRRRRGAEAKVPHVRVVGDDAVEVPVYVRRRELRERTGVDAQPVQHRVDAWEEVRAEVAEEHVRCAGAAVRRGDGGQAAYAERRWADARDEVARVEAAHAVCDDVDGAAGRVLCDLVGECGGARFDRPRAWDGRCDAFDPVACEGVFDPPPVVDAGEQGPGEAPFVET